MKIVVMFFEILKVLEYLKSLKSNVIFLMFENNKATLQGSAFLINILGSIGRMFRGVITLLYMFFLYGREWYCCESFTLNSMCQCLGKRGNHNITLSASLHIKQLYSF